MDDENNIEEEKEKINDISPLFLIKNFAGDPILLYTFLEGVNLIECGI